MENDQNYPQVEGQQTPQNQNRTISSHSTASLVLGLVATVAWIIPLIGYPVTIIGLVQGAKGFREDGSGRATAGKVLNIIFLIFTVFSSIFGILYMSGAF